MTPPLRDGSAQEANDEPDLEKFLDKIRYHVKVNRIRVRERKVKKLAINELFLFFQVTEFFRDFDLLRTGSITENHFRQVEYFN